jgi:hypothetical protein
VPAPLPGDLVEAGDGGIGVDGVVDEVGQGLAGELVDDKQDLDHPPGGGDVELVVEGPHVIGPLGAEPVSGRGRLAEALALATPGGNRRPSSRQTLDLRAVHHVPLPAQHGVRPPVAPAGMAAGEAAQTDGRS